MLKIEDLADNRVSLNGSKKSSKDFTAYFAGVRKPVVSRYS